MQDILFLVFVSFSFFAHCALAGARRREEMLREKRERWRSCWASPCQGRWETPWASRSPAPPCWASQSRGRAGNLKTAQPSRLPPTESSLHNHTRFYHLIAMLWKNWWSAIGEFFCTSMQWSVLMSPWCKIILFYLLIEMLYKDIWLTIAQIPPLLGLQAKSSMESIVGNFEVPERGDNNWNSYNPVTFLK